MINEIINTTNGKSIQFFEDENGIENSDMEFCQALFEWLNYFEGNKKWSETIKLDIEGVIIDQHYIETARSEKRPGGVSKYSINYSQKTLMEAIAEIDNFGWFVQEFSYGNDFTEISVLMNKFRLKLEQISEEKLTPPIH